ncbi:MAG: gliding motility-associated C-terminal domain-containing protein [Chitinophagaceae bacterium]|nr:gliding motility-associated C-terminal domain-containing protein [Chitinophagaceae bacterium]
MPLNLPNTAFLEKNYNNNIASRSNFQFKVTVNPLTATLEPGDSLQLTANAGPFPATYNWSPSYNLSCTDCYNPIHIAGKDTTLKVSATSTYGCIDSAYTIIKVPPADDYVIRITEVECSGTNQLYAAFTICNNFRRGVIPKGLKVSFYDADPSTGNANLLGPVFTTSQNYTDKCVSFGHYFNRTAPGKIYAVVNDNGTTIPLNLPNNSSLSEKVYTNNKTDFDYVQQYVQLQPADTTVYRKETYIARMLTNVSDPASIKWQTSNSYSLSCIDCATPAITVTDNATIKMQMNNQYGCIIPGEMKVKIFPPDMTVEIMETACYTNTSTLVKFRICANNGYDTIANNLPVSFYETIANGSPKILSPVFTTTRTEPTGCAVFAHIINSPVTQSLFAVVNDKGKGASSIPEPYITETNYSNNIQQKTIVPFSVTVSPADTSILRASTIQLQGQAVGGTVSFIQWEPSENLSCTNCLNPLATSQPSAQYKLTVQNEYLCTASAYAIVKTYTGRKINIPSAFTPNNDGLNDVFYIMAGKEVTKVVNLSVFNRWGEKVFESTNSPANDRSYGWNGTLKGKNAEGGVYVYLATVEFVNGKEQFKGTVTLIR